MKPTGLPGMPGILCLVALGFSVACPSAAEAEEGSAPEVLIRCDDVGMCHAANLAVRQLLATGIPFSTSVMVPCPWFPEAAELLRDQSRVSVGIHLTLNSEWEHYKWGPVLGAAAVPSLVDEQGYFHATEADFAAAGFDLEEVEMELRAQIDRALGAGLRIDYLDYHMLTALSTPELQEVVERLARDYGVGLSRYFGERSASLWDVAPERKLDSLLGFLEQIDASGPNLLVMHLGLETPEMLGLVDLNNAADPYRVGRHRESELEALSSPAVRQRIESRGIRLLNYRDLIERHGLEAMQRPASVGYSMEAEDD